MIGFFANFSTLFNLIKFNNQQSIYDKLGQFEKNNSENQAQELLEIANYRNKFIFIQLLGQHIVAIYSFSYPHISES